MPQTTAVVIDSQAAFTTAFPGVLTGTNGGRWRYDGSGSSQSSSTGPGTNNSLSFMHTETSSATSLQEAETRGIAVFGEVPDQAGRTLRLRLCIQGVFGDGTEGLEVQHRASDQDAWTQAGFVHGWDYSDNRSANDQITDENGHALTIAADGGWVDFVIAIPDTSTQVRLHPRYVAGAGSSYQHDLALRSFHWEWPEPEDSGTDHAVDAVPATWSFATPEPSVRRARRRDAGTVTWMFEFPEPAVKRTRRRDAEPAVWSFETSEPEVTVTRRVRLQVPDVPTLLPPNATPLERALEAATRPRASEEVIRQVWDPWACPAKLLPWLAWAFSVDYWEEDWSEDQKRAVIAASIEVHRRKGTPAAMRRVVEGLGYGFDLVEWWELEPEGTPGTAEAYIFRKDAGRPVTREDLRLARKLLEDAKRATLHLTVTPSHQVSARTYLYARSDAHKYASFAYNVSRLRYATASMAQLYLYARADAYEHQEYSYEVGR